LCLTTEDGSSGEQSLVTEVVEKLLKSNTMDGLYACGPTGMLTALASLAKKYDVPYQLSWEALMRCGMGLCGSCEVPQTCDPALPAGWLACFDGPVFRHP
jgi:dihydroorotate dehydrogenase electron transfer subunit